MGELQMALEFFLFKLTIVLVIIMVFTMRPVFCNELGLDNKRRLCLIGFTACVGRIATLVCPLIRMAR